MSEKYIWFERVQGCEERFYNDYADGSVIDGKYQPRSVSSGWWITVSPRSDAGPVAYCVGPVRPEVHVGQRVRFTMEPI